MIRNRKELVNLVKEQQLKGAGGVLFDDVLESLPDAEEMLKVNYFFNHIYYKSPFLTSDLDPKRVSKFEISLKKFPSEKFISV